MYDWWTGSVGNQISPLLLRRSSVKIFYFNKGDNLEKSKFIEKDWQLHAYTIISI